MKFKWKTPWPLVIYVEKWFPNVGGTALGPVIVIREKYINDEGIYRHEVFHVAQWAACWALWALGVFLIQPSEPQWVYYVLGALFFPLVYQVVEPFKLWSEVKGYQQQMKYPDKDGNLMSPETAAKRLMSRIYGFSLTPEKALSYFK